MRRLRRALRRLAHAQARRPAPVAPALGCVEPVAQPHADWARLEAERLLDDEIGGAFMIGDDVDVPPPVLAAMDAIVRDRERRHV